MRSRFKPKEIVIDFNYFDPYHVYWIYYFEKSFKVNIYLVEMYENSTYHSMLSLFSNILPATLLPHLPVCIMANPYAPIMSFNR